MNLEITSAARYEKSVQSTAAAVFVITGEDIRRSGAVTLPDLFKMVPGMQSFRSDPGDFAVGTRGFVGEFANKLLVLVDGRSIYTPTFAGVEWMFEEGLLENIERIEVIRGPGAALWGSNAVNGVINIITKHSTDTQGALAVATAGTTEEWYEAFRYGTTIGDNLSCRAYIKQMQYGTVDNPRQAEPELVRGGFRVDWMPSEENTFLLTGGYYNSHEKSWTSRPLPTPLPRYIDIKGHGYYSGLHLMGRWEHTFSPDSDMALQVSYSRDHHRANRYAKQKQAEGHPDLEKDKYMLEIWDIDFQHRFPLGLRQDVVWGFAIRQTRDYKRDTNIFFALDPDSRFTYLYSGFVQDRIDLVRDRLTLILGARCEYNSYTDFELQPNARLMWTPNRRHTLWAAVSRAVRIPSRYERDGNIRLSIIPRTPLSPRMLVEAKGNNSFDAETLLAYELGYRTFFFNRVSLDVTAFLNDYSRLRTLEPASPQWMQGYFRYPFEYDNDMDGTTYGFEAVTNWNPLPWWRLQATYSFLHMDLDPRSGSDAGDPTAADDLSPRHQYTLRSMMDLWDAVELDVSLYFTDDIPGYGIKRYTNLIVRLGWTPVPGLSLELIGHNLLDNRHNEFSDEIYRRAENEIRRTVYARISWRF
jgi:iron complex outermembrane receptor protein